MDGEFSLSDETYVDVHGRTVSAGILKATGELFVSLHDVQQAGFQMFKKQDYSRLKIKHSDLTKEFDLHLLNAGKEYMLANRVQFDPSEILASIEQCKEVLLRGTETKQVKSAKNNTRKHESETVKPGPSQTLTSSPLTVENVKKHEANLDNSRDSDRNSSISEAAGPPINRSSNGGRYNNGYQQKKERLPQVSFDKEVHKVMVSCVVKTRSNTAWVQDTESQDTLIEIYSKITESERHQKPLPLNSLEVETFYMAKEGEDWFRCKVIKFKPLQVFFVDYGNVCEVSEVKSLPDELKQYPSQAVKINASQSAHLEEEQELLIKPISKLPCGTVLVDILDDPEEDMNSDKKKIFNAPPFPKLSNGERVSILSTQNNRFFLRTKDCYERLTKLDLTIKDLQKKSLNCADVEIDELVLVRDIARKTYSRGVVLAIRSREFEIQLLDSHIITVVDAEHLFEMPESIAKEPRTIILSPILKGFQTKTFTSKIKACIQAHADNRTKFTVVMPNPNDFDLVSSSSLISKELLQLLNDNKNFTKAEHMERFQPEIGWDSYMCGTMNNIDDIILIPIELMTQHQNVIVQGSLDDNTPYTPSLNEVCYCLFNDEWYRGEVIKVDGDRFQMYLVDFGNVEWMTAKDLRQRDDLFLSAPILGTKCRLINCPVRSNALKLIKQFLVEEDVYSVNVKNKTGEVYDVEIPSINDKLKKM